MLSERMQLKKGSHLLYRVFDPSKNVEPRLPLKFENTTYEVMNNPHLTGSLVIVALKEISQEETTGED